MTILQELSSPPAANAEVQVNENFETLSASGIFGKKHSTTTGLTWGYYGGRYNGNTQADGTVSLTDDATNYVVVLRSTGVVSVSTNDTNATDSLYARLYRVTTVDGVVTAVVDERQETNGLLFVAPSTGAVASVNGATGAVVLDADDIEMPDPTNDFGSPQTVGAALRELAALIEAAGGSAGKHAVYIAAGSMQPSSSGGCAALATLNIASGQPDIHTLDFDATTQEYAQFSVAMPKSWNEGTVTFKPVWSHAATVTNFGVVWDLQAVAISNDDAMAAAFGTAQTSTDTGGTTNDLYVGPESSAITIAGTPAAEDTVFFRVSRVTGNGSDTMTIDARLHGIVMFITTDAENDA